MIEPNFLWVTIGCMLLAIASSRVGLYYFLQKKSLSGDVISHALLPGVVAGYLLAGEKNLLFLFMGAFITGFLSVLVMEWVQRATFLKSDVSMAVVLSTFYGIGVVLLTYTNRLPLGNQAGLDTFLFGKAASLTPADVKAYAVLAVLMLLVVWLLDRSLFILSFDAEYAASVGMKVRIIQNILTILIISAVVLGVQAVGVVLMSAFLILPPMAGRLLSTELRLVKLYSLVIAVIMAISGSVISYSYSKMPTGPVMVVAGGSVVIAILLMKYINRRIAVAQNRRAIIRKIQREDVLKFIYKTSIEEKSPVTTSLLSGYTKPLSAACKTNKDLNRTLKFLLKEDLLTYDQDHIIKLTKKGLTEAERIIRIHRLLEVYQATRLSKKPDALHAGADIWEHFIPESIEKMLIEELNKPEKDPHDKYIPYDRP